MSRILICLLLVSLFFSPDRSSGQTVDSTKAATTFGGSIGPTNSTDKSPAESATSTQDQNITTFSGSVGITNNGFSIVPSFSLNSPAAIMNFYWRKKRFSFDPDVRLVPDLSKGTALFWFRYRLIEQKKFSLRVGVHPAFNLVKQTITENGKTSEITEVIRAAAGEVVPAYQITPNWNISAVYLHGTGLHYRGPRKVDVLFLNTSISNINVGGDFRLSLIPSVFLLVVDATKGSYFTATAMVSKKNLPFTLQSTINQTFTSDIPGNQNFMWNVLLAYNFSRSFRRIQ
jgi:hypothetical protein